MVAAGGVNLSWSPPSSTVVFPDDEYFEDQKWDVQLVTLTISTHLGGSHSLAISIEERNSWTHRSRTMTSPVGKVNDPQKPNRQPRGCR
jgi:hypothetical protein